MGPGEWNRGRGVCRSNVVEEEAAELGFVARPVTRWRGMSLRCC